MFDVGFWELCLVGIVSLLVIGPEKLPKVARVAGFWIGKGRRMVATVKSEIKDELQAEEMRQLLQEQTGAKDFQQVFREGQEAMNDFKASIDPLIDEDKSTDQSK